MSIAWLVDTLPPQLRQLTESLRTLPGIGARSAMRMALHLIEQRHHQQARKLAEHINTATEKVQLCRCCRHLATSELCSLCRSHGRDDSLLCVVESPTDLIAIESSGGYAGRYFVLHGKLSPIDGVGPEQLGFDQLEAMIAHSHQGLPYPDNPGVIAAPVSEVILALGTTVEGNVTCHYLQRRLAAYKLRITRPAQGIPAGGNVEMLDSITLGQALLGRVEVEQDD